MLKIGLTGGIGSGKTTVAKVFERLGIPVYYSDGRAKSIMLRSNVATQIREQFGDQAYDAKGELNREYLAKEVFSCSDKLALLNSIVHPAVRQDFELWCTQHQSECVVIEAAILIESGLYEAVDEIVVVIAPENVRIKRVVKRDSQVEESVRKRIASQMSDDQRLTYATYVIRADETELLIPQILKIESEIQKKRVSLHAKI